MIPTCPTCRRRDEAEALDCPPVGDVKSFHCGRCNLVFSGSEHEANASHHQRALMEDTRRIYARTSSTPPPPTQQELTTDA